MTPVSYNPDTLIDVDIPKNRKDLQFQGGDHAKIRKYKKYLYRVSNKLDRRNVYDLQI